MTLVRLQIELEQEEMDELEKLVEQGGLRTKKELFNNAFSLLRWAVRERRSGRSIVSADREGRPLRELSMPFLDSFVPAEEERPRQPIPKTSTLRRAK